MYNLWLTRSTAKLISVTLHNDGCSHTIIVHEDLFSINIESMISGYYNIASVQLTAGTMSLYADDVMFYRIIRSAIDYKPTSIVYVVGLTAISLHLMPSNVSI